MSGARPSEARIYGLLWLMLAIWSFNYIVTKIAFHTFPALWLAAARNCLAGAVMLPVYLLTRNSRPPGPAKGESLRLSLLATLGIPLNQFLFVFGIAHTSVAHAGITIALTPILVLLLATSTGQERLTLRKSVGMAVALAGVTLLQISRKPGSAATLYGDAIVFSGALVFSLYTVWAKPYTKRYGGLTMSMLAYTGGTLASLPAAVWLWGSFDARSVGITGWLCLLYMAALSSVLGYFIFNYALSYFAASRVSSFSYLQPVLASLMAIPILGETLGAASVAGGALTLAGVYVTERG